MLWRNRCYVSEKFIQLIVYKFKTYKLQKKLRYLSVNKCPTRIHFVEKTQVFSHRLLESYKVDMTLGYIR